MNLAKQTRIHAETLSDPIHHAIRAENLLTGAAGLLLNTLTAQIRLGIAKQGRK